MKTTFKAVVGALLIAVTSYAAAGTTKVIGHYGKYNVYDMKSEDLDDALPYNVDGETDVDGITLAKRLKPVDVADINKNGILCKFLCEDPQERVIGYNPIAYANELRFRAMSPAALQANARALAKAKAASAAASSKR